jgi:hypothetical protein
MIAGLGVWMLCVCIETEYPALVYGLLASFLGMVAGMLWEKAVGSRLAS